jgi:hypothetical protein
MVLGYNHNVRYRGELFHVQTEDSGLANPTIITLLYRGGTIIASRKTSYADIVKIENLEMIVEELMKDQHKEMLRHLKNGDFDDRAFPGGGPAPETDIRRKPEPEPEPKPLPRRESNSQATAPRSLDDILLDYLASEERK